MAVLVHSPTALRQGGTDAARRALQVVDPAQRIEVGGWPAPGDRRRVARVAGLAADRIERGIDALAVDEDALDAFRVANRAVSAALKRRLKPENEPTWRPFQLAFILMNLPGIADPRDPTARRSTCCSSRPAAARPRRTSAWPPSRWFCAVCDPGMAVGRRQRLMRYTLRLLTLDQLARAATLICALELERQQDPEATASGRSRSAYGSAGGNAEPHGRKGDGRSDSARAKMQPSRTTTASPRRSHSRSARGAGRIPPDSFALLPERRHPPSCGSSARTSTATSPATARCRSSPSTSRSTGGCPRSSSRLSTSSRRCRGSGETGAFSEASSGTTRGLLRCREPGRGQPLSEPSRRRT